MTLKSEAQTYSEIAAETPETPEGREVVICSILAPFYIYGIEQVVALGEDSDAVAVPRALPRHIRAEQMVAGNAVRSRPVIGIRARRRVEIGIHPVVELPVDTYAES